MAYPMESMSDTSDLESKQTYTYEEPFHHDRSPLDGLWCYRQQR